MTVNICIFMAKIAITVVAYNRVDSLARLLNSLANASYGADEVPLIISIDKSDTDEVEKFADEYMWRYGTKTVRKHSENMGLRKHVLEQGNLLQQYDAVVVLEDDLVVAQDFWNYTQQTVRMYAKCDEIAGISLYSFAVNYHQRHPFMPIRDGHDVYFMNSAMSWGQVWMRKQWRNFVKWYSANQNFDDRPHLPQSICSWGEKSWLKYHTRYCIEENKYFVFPYISYTTNYSEVGTHIRDIDSIFQVQILQGRIENLRLPEYGSEAVYYDGFFENKKLYKILGLCDTDCCLDLNGTNGNREHKRYWLTTRNLPYRIVRSYNYACRPLEQNVLSGCDGSGIFLYDTSCRDASNKHKGNPAFIATHFIQNSFLFIREYGYMNVLRDFIKLLRIKIR